MVEIEEKYKIYEKKFGYVNWIGFWTLYKKEVLRFLKVVIQTIISPLVTSLLFLMVLSLAIGSDRGEALGFPFITFLAPGLIAMQIIQQAFSHTSSSIMIGKIQGNIVDILYAPLSPGEVTLATILAACTRSIIIASVSMVIFSLIIDLKFYNFYYIFIFTFLGSFILGALVLWLVYGQISLIIWPQLRTLLLYLFLFYQVPFTRLKNCQKFCKK